MKESNHGRHLQEINSSNFKVHGIKINESIMSREQNSTYYQGRAQRSLFQNILKVNQNKTKESISVITSIIVYWMLIVLTSLMRDKLVGDQVAPFNRVKMSTAQYIQIADLMYKSVVHLQQQYLQIIGILPKDRYASFSSIKVYNGTFQANQANLAVRKQLGVYLQNLYFLQEQDLVEFDKGFRQSNLESSDSAVYSAYPVSSALQSLFVEFTYLKDLYRQQTQQATIILPNQMYEQMKQFASLIQQNVLGSILKAQKFTIVARQVRFDASRSAINTMIGVIICLSTVLAATSAFAVFRLKKKILLIYSSF